MPQLTIEYRDVSERLVLERAIAYAADLDRVAQTAADGTVLKMCEDLALDKGREMLRTTLSAALEGRLAEAEKKGGRPASASRRTPDAPRASTCGPS
jgi:hypothetical protein